MASRKRISRFFVMEEFDSRDGQRVPRHAEDDIERLVEYWLDPLRRKFGPVHILSGFRSEAHNAAVGGASQSVHKLKTPLPGRRARSAALAAAADVLVRGHSAAEVHAWALQQRRRSPYLASKGRGGVGLYVRSGFVHVDTAGLRDWRG